MKTRIAKIVGALAIAVMAAGGVMAFSNDAQASPCIHDHGRVEASGRCTHSGSCGSANHTTGEQFCYKCKKCNPSNPDAY